MKSYTKSIWSGTVKFTCNTCNVNKIYKLNEKQTLEDAERSWKASHPKECK